LEKENFKLLWKQIPSGNELVYEIPQIKPSYKEAEKIKDVLKKNNIFFIASRINDQSQSIWKE
jgi:hypothetical protein